MTAPSGTSANRRQGDGPPGTRRCGLAAVAILMLLAALLWWLRIWGDPPFTAPESVSDLLRYYLPNAYYAQHMLLEGQFPLWNPYYLLGGPHFATIEYGPLYPPNPLLYLLPPRMASSAGALLDLALMASFTFVYLRHGLRLRVGSALFGASSMTFTTFYLFSTVYEPNTAHAIALLPLVLFLTDRVTAGRNPVWLAGLALALAVQFFAGDPEGSARTAQLLAVYAAVRLVQQGRQVRSVKVPLGSAARLIGAGALSLALAAIQLGPAFELMRNSERVAGRLSFEQAFGGGQESLLALLAQMAGAADMPGHVPTGSPAPTYFGYAGLALAALAILTVRWKPRIETVFFAVFAVLYLELLQGEESVAARVYYHLPMGSWFRYPIRFLPFLLFCVTVLSALGLDSLLDGLGGGAKRSVRARVAAGLVCAMALGAFAVNLAVSNDVTGICMTGLALCAVLLCVCIWRGMPKAASTVLVAGLVALTWVVSWWTYDFYLYTLPCNVQLVGLPGEVVRFLEGNLEAGERVYADYAVERGRRVPNVGTLLMIPSLTGQTPLVPEGYWDLVHEYRSGRLLAGDRAAPVPQTPVGLWGGLAVESGANGLWNVLGVRYLVLGPGNEVFGPVETGWQTRYTVPGHLRQVLATDGIAVYENTAAWPRAFVVEGDRHDAERLLEAGLADGEPPPRNVFFERYDPHRVELALRGVPAGLLVLTDQSYPGWQAWVGGERRDLVELNGVLRGVPVKPGDEHVTMVYAPASFTLGAAVSLASVLGILAALGTALRCRARRRA